MRYLSSPAPDAANGSSFYRRHYPQLLRLSHDRGQHPQRLRLRAMVFVIFSPPLKPLLQVPQIKGPVCWAIDFLTRIFHENSSTRYILMKYSGKGRNYEKPVLNRKLEWACFQAINNCRYNPTTLVDLWLKAHRTRWFLGDRS